MPPDNARHVVEAPVRSALIRIVARGLLLVGVTLLAVLCPVIPELHHFDDEVAIAVPTLLILYAIGLKVERRVRAPVNLQVRASAWFKAREIDDADAMLALVIAGWVPVALLAALVVMAWPHLSDGSAMTRGAWGAIGVPVLFVAWILSTNAWLEGCRDELARAIGESERRFRSYWANVGR